MSTARRAYRLTGGPYDGEVVSPKGAPEILEMTTKPGHIVARYKLTDASEYRYVGRYVAIPNGPRGASSTSAQSRDP